MKKANRVTCWIVIAVILLTAYLSVFGAKIGKLKVPSAEDMRFGIDIRGGVEATYVPKNFDGVPTSAQLDAAKAVIETRCDAQNILDREIKVDLVNKSIFVSFPWKSDEKEFKADKAIKELGETALLTFRDPQGNILLEGKNVKKASAGHDPQTGAPVVELKFDKEGSKLFEQATGMLVGQQMAILMDDVMISNPSVTEKIVGDGAVITGLENTEAAMALASKINSGSLPFALESKDYNAISPTMGSKALDVMVQAGILALLIIGLFMIIYYRLPGFVAVFALLLQIAGQLLALSVPQFTLTLPGIAAVILSIGMGVDANIITAERIKEEIADGKSVRAAIDAGFHKAFSSVFDGNITVIIVAIMLMVFGSGTMLSFGYSLLTGVLLNFLCGVLASKLMLRSLGQHKMFRKTWLYGSGKKKDKVINFYKNRKIYFIISFVVIAIGVASMFINGTQFDIEFKGGSLLTYTYTDQVDVAKAERVAEDSLGMDIGVQTKQDIASNETKLVISLSEKEKIASADQEKLSNALAEAFPKNDIKIADVRVVEPSIGKRFAVDSSKAIIFSIVLIILYVWYSFRKVSGLSAGVSGIVALFHDVLIVFLTFVIFKMPVNESFISAALTILGFSINDTIVIYDRIRENKRKAGSKEPIEEIVDKSITQSISRSVNTNLCTLLSIVIVYVFAYIQDISSIKTFALPMIFGIISGCYSTICIAGPLWTGWQKRKEKRILSAKAR
ncbi:MAG: protein translocase subunit SecD [Eubacteriales bacterium]|nr:protein translocase subunit SecD [Eubacteriales bacterium]